MDCTELLIPAGAQARRCWKIYRHQQIFWVRWTEAWRCPYVWNWGAAQRPEQSWLETGLWRSREGCPISWWWPMGVSHLSFFCVPICLKEITSIWEGKEKWLAWWVCATEWLMNSKYQRWQWGAMQHLKPFWYFDWCLSLQLWCSYGWWLCICRDFVNCVRCIRILSPQEERQMRLASDYGDSFVGNQACSSSDGGRPWRVTGD